MPDFDNLESAAHLASPAAMGSILSNGAYRRARHLDILSNALVDLAMGDISALMVLMPPRHGKTETCSKWFPAWLYSIWPNTKIISGSYDFSLARDAGEWVRDRIIENSPHIGVYLSKGSRAKRIWKTSAGGEYFAAGVGSGVTGRGADFLLLDDVVKGIQDAASLRIQERNWNWWINDFSTRLNRTGRGGRRGGILAVGTRWHENDLLGKLLQAFKAGPGTQGYERWTVVCMPAEAEDHDVLGRHPTSDVGLFAKLPENPTQAELEAAIGDPLWPEGGYDREWIRTTRPGKGSYTWAALYQQRPSPAEGGIIKKGWIQRYEDTPDVVDFIATSWDMSFKKTGTSFVVGQVWARVGGDFYLLDQVRKKMDFVETCAEFRAMAKRWPEARAHYVEDKANGSAVISALRKEIPGIIAVEPEGGKESRLFAVSPIFEAHNVHVPADEPWADDLIYEAICFPNAPNDDQVDAMSQALVRMAVKRLHQGVITAGVFDDAINEAPLLDTFGYTPNVGMVDGDIDDVDDGPSAGRRPRFGYTPR